jgi:hypothetical protein
VLAGYEDHLKRFPACAYVTLARLKINQLNQDHLKRQMDDLNLLRLAELCAPFQASAKDQALKDRFTAVQEKFKQALTQITEFQSRIEKFGESCVVWLNRGKPAGPVKDAVRSAQFGAGEASTHLYMTKHELEAMDLPGQLAREQNGPICSQQIALGVKAINGAYDTQVTRINVVGCSPD